MSLRDGQFGDRIPVGGDIFRTRPDRPWGPPSPLYNGHRTALPGVKGRGVALTRLKKEWNYSLLPICVFTTCYKVNFFDSGHDCTANLYTLDKFGNSKGPGDHTVAGIQFI
jgi:hypothetical protein